MVTIELVQYQCILVSFFSIVGALTIGIVSIWAITWPLRKLYWIDKGQDDLIESVVGIEKKLDMKGDIE